MSERLDGLRVLTISAYDAEPALYWQHRFRDMFPGAQWTHIGLQPDHFSWRVRGNALRLAHHYADELGRGYDLIIVTSLVDLATLRGLAPKIIATPTLVYFYENCSFRIGDAGQIEGSTKTRGKSPHVYTNSSISEENVFAKKSKNQIGKRHDQSPDPKVDSI